MSDQIPFLRKRLAAGRTRIQLELHVYTLVYVQMSLLNEGFVADLTGVELCVRSVRP